MKRARRTTKTGGETATSEDEVFVLQFRIWLKDVSPMVWRRVQVPSTTTLHEFHGVLQVVMLLTRTQTLDGSLRSTFRQWYPGMANDNHEKPETARAG